MFMYRISLLCTLDHTMIRHQTDWMPFKLQLGLE
jgi:hypothetical protein